MRRQGEQNIIICEQFAKNGHANGNQCNHVWHRRPHAVTTARTLSRPEFLVFALLPDRTCPVEFFALIILPGVEYLPKLATSDFGFSVCWFYGCLFVFTTFNFALSALSILVPLHTRMFCYPNGTYSFLAPRRKIYTLKFEKSLKNNDEFIGKIQKNSAVQQWLQAMRFRAHRAARI